MKKMLKTASKKIIISPSYDFLNHELPIITVHKKLQIAMPENSFYVPS